MPAPTAIAFALSLPPLACRSVWSSRRSGRAASRQPRSTSPPPKNTNTATMPIPAPATAKLLLGAPLAPTTLKGELTTPTGAAILATLVQEWIEQPVMRIESIGLGAGTRDYLEQPNVLRVFLGEKENVNPS